MASREEKIASEILSRYSETEQFKQDLKLMVTIDKLQRGLSRMIRLRKDFEMGTVKKVAKTKKTKTTKRK